MGFAIMPDILGPTARLTLAAERRDVTESAFPDDLDPDKRMHYGMEVSLYPQANGAWLINLRAGRSQGLVSWGVVGGMLGRYATVDFVHYQEQLGSDSTLNSQPQRRYVLQVTLGI